MFQIDALKVSNLPRMLIYYGLKIVKYPHLRMYENSTLQSKSIFVERGGL